MRTHWDADCLLEDFSGKKTHENIVNEEFEYLDDVIFRELDFIIRVLLHYGQPFWHTHI